LRKSDFAWLYLVMSGSWIRGRESRTFHDFSWSYLWSQKSDFSLPLLTVICYVRVSNVELALIGQRPVLDRHNLGPAWPEQGSLTLKPSTLSSRAPDSISKVEPVPFWLHPPNWHICLTIVRFVVRWLNYYPPKVRNELDSWLGVDYTCVLDVQFGCAFLCRKRFQCHFLCWKIKNDVENACDDETHIQTAYPKRKCNQPLRWLNY
jgi:hypothetical protein